MEIFELIENGNYNLIKEVINSLELESVNKDGDTALHYAVKNRDLELLEIILAYIPDLDVENENGDSALHLAVLTSDSDLVQRLLNFGANPNVKDSKKRIPATLASQLKKDVIYRLLSAESDEPSSKMKSKKTNLIDE